LQEKSQKKPSYFCIITTTKPKIVVTICLVKQQDKGGGYKKKHTWQLSEVKNVDGRSEAKDTHEFDLTLDSKQYRWFAANLHERQNFLTVLWKQINKFVVTEKPSFKNIAKSWLVESPVRTVETLNNPTKVSAEDMDLNDYEDFQALTEKEEMDLNKLIDMNQLISNAEKFMEDLSKNLQELDGANVQSVLASEKQVELLMEEIETAILEAEKVEQRLDDYDEILCHIRDTMEKMGEKNTMIEIANSNNVKLMQELEKVVVS
jgi:exocyst complex component 1